MKNYEQMFESVFTEYLIELLKLNDTLDVDAVSKRIRPFFKNGFDAGLYVAEMSQRGYTFPEPSVN